MPGTRLVYSKGQVKRAGEVLRVLPVNITAGWTSKEVTDFLERTRHAIEVAENWRASHAYALQKATVGLRSRVRTVSVDARVSQRHKRMATIIDKLGREPAMRLDRMHDIAGCRAVVDTMADLRALQHRNSTRPPPGGVRRTYDYVSTPKASGYRGVHLVVQYDERQVEVQLRTVVQHEWALTTERLGGRLGVDLKSGYGPPEVLRFMEIAAEAMAIEERGDTVDAVRLEQFRAAQRAAEPLLSGGEPR